MNDVKVYKTFIILDFKRILEETFFSYRIREHVKLALLYNRGRELYYLSTHNMIICVKGVENYELTREFIAYNAHYNNRSVFSSKI